MAHFLALPHELRDNIIERVLLCPNRISQTFNDLTRTHHQPIQDEADFNARNELPFLNLTDTLKPPIPALPLLLTCKQLNNETNDVIQRLRPHALLNYEIEAKYVQRCAWFLTWRHIPFLECCVDRLYVEVQTIGILQHTPLTYSLASSSGVEDLIPLLFTMLQRLFRSPGETIWVEHLELEFIEPIDVEVLPPKGAHAEQWYKRLGIDDNSHTITGTHRVMEPQMLCTLLEEDIEGTLAEADILDNEQSLKFAWFGDVTLKVDGVERRTLDMRRMLATRGLKCLQPNGF